MASKKKTDPNRYARIVEAIFRKKYRPGLDVIEFTRSELAQTAERLGIEVPKNLGDIVYTFRYRVDFPAIFTETAPVGNEWSIESTGTARYAFALRQIVRIAPNPMLAAIKIPDATPGIIEKYAINDEQGLLAKLRYNRLIDMFTGLACYSLQNHLRTAVKDIGQVETDEVYLGIDRSGIHYVLPVQAKGGRDRLGVTQIEHDFAMGAAKFRGLVCVPIAAQFIEPNLIAMFRFQSQPKGDIRIGNECHYRLVPHDQVSEEDLANYRTLHTT